VWKRSQCGDQRQWGLGGGFRSFGMGETGNNVFLGKRLRLERRVDRGFRMSGVYSNGLYGVAVFTWIDMLDLLLKKYNKCNKLIRAFMPSQ